MYGALDISTSGLLVQRTRLNAIAGNLANQQTILNAEGRYEPYQRREVLVAAGDPSSGRREGVHVAGIRLSDNPPIMKYEPHSEFADENGYVGYPDINPVVEQVNALEAMRAYEANIIAIEATKSMMNVAMRMIG